MNILLINHYAGSPEYGMEFRPYHMCKEWVKRGHKTLIVGGSYSHLRKLQPISKTETIDGVNYSWVKLNKYKGNGLGRIVSMGMFITKLGMNYKNYLGGFAPDVVIASSTYPLDIYPARKIAKHFGAKLVYEVHDLWPLAPMEVSGHTLKHPFFRLIQHAEDYCYRHVDAVVSMLPKAEPHMLDHGLSSGKFYCVPNGIVLEDWENCRPLKGKHIDVISALKKDGKFVIGYTGAHGLANSLYAAIDAAIGVADENIAFVLVGTGPEKENLKKFAQSKGARNVYFLDPIGKSYIPSLLKSMDALYIGLQPQKAFQYGISPNKMFDYMMAEKPIIQAIQAGNNIVEEAHCGIFTMPNDIPAIRKAMLEIKNMEPSKREVLGKNGKKFVMEHHTYSVLSENFLSILEKINK